MSRILSLAVAAAVCMACVAGPAAIGKARLPAKVGDCVATKILAIGGRLEGMPDSGTSVDYTDGLSVVSYDVDKGAKASRIGDPVTVCLTELPHNCPKGDDRGKTYSTTNLRTHQRWVMADSEHMCGGA